MNTTLDILPAAYAVRPAPDNKPQKRAYCVKDTVTELCATVYARNRGFGADYWEVIAQDGADRDSRYSAAAIVIGWGVLEWAVEVVRGMVGK